ncbi:GGDEF domain-containing protein [Salinivibrio sp. IB868]|uniref:sensor domain-containing diguanylate cyclase n=1 Tax=unclassified Salinivibrio TaxID=2636825 RepID=UPI000985974F|nr:MULTISPECIES: sensor domain-containing diguanylate cyclase [unclassified Salinivibrio]OOE69647.1 GGDEF domain-containing protein [Salinivibrio sp. IB868]OOE73518.1 GGDEF domain-containing protein [Salinivibrio sp. IB870]
MLSPIKPQDEEQRLKKLQETGLLDSEDEERFDRITRLAKRLFDVPIALVSLIDNDRQWFKSCFGLNVRQTSRDISFCGHAILGNQPFVVQDASADPRFADNPLVTGEPHIRFYAGHPLSLSDGTNVGTLCVIDTQPRRFSQEDLRFLKDLALLAESELSSAHTAYTDDITGISNRRGFMQLASRAVQHCQSINAPYSLAFLDLNNFKAINDTYGHAEGDIALSHLANLLRANMRESDVFARFGGDEFVVFLYGTGRQEAENALERFAGVVERFNQINRHTYPLSFSQGIATSSATSHRGLDDLLDEADTKMYQQKMGKKANSGDER